MNYILKIDCPDEKGLIYRISQTLYKNDLNIEKNSEFVDHDKQKFFFRARISGEINVETIKNELKEKLPENTNIYLKQKRKKNIVILVTKESHCLGDLLIRHNSGELNANILAVASNYELLKPLVDKFHIPYHFVSHEGLSREAHEEKMLDVLKNYQADYMILAKYMRILTSNFVKPYNEKIINIHHSFLPAFIGANPYKQAHERGVKIIGATAHFVNDNLDEGPIISQDVISVNHNLTWKDMQRAGRNVEKTVLSNALDLVFEDRIFVNQNKTIIF